LNLIVLDSYVFHENYTFTDTGPCHLKHCRNGGFCDATQTCATCICPIGFVGRECENGMYSLYISFQYFLECIFDKEILRIHICK
jgi:hypothetical protein